MRLTPVSHAPHPNPSLKSASPQPLLKRPSPQPLSQGRGAKSLDILFFLPFSPGRRGRGMRVNDREKGSGA